MTVTDQCYFQIVCSHNGLGLQLCTVSTASTRRIHVLENFLFTKTAIDDIQIVLYLSRVMFISHCLRTKLGSSKSTWRCLNRTTISRWENNSTSRTAAVYISTIMMARRLQKSEAPSCRGWTCVIPVVVSKTRMNCQCMPKNTSCKSSGLRNL